MNYSLKTVELCFVKIFVIFPNKTTFFMNTYIVNKVINFNKEKTLPLFLIYFQIKKCYYKRNVKMKFDQNFSVTEKCFN